MPFKRKCEKASWVSGFFDGEGGVGVYKSKNRKTGKVNRGWTYTLRATNTEYELIDRAYRFLSDLGIASRIRERKDKSAYDIYITGRENFENFEKICNFTLERKRKKLRELIETYKWKVTPTIGRKIVTLWNEGKYGVDISKQLKLSCPTVAYHLRKNGITLLSLKEISMRGHERRWNYVPV
jgi:hypothetical protein